MSQMGQRRSSDDVRRTTDVLAHDKPCFPQALTKRGRQVQGIGKRRAAEEPDYWHRRLLCARLTLTASNRPPPPISAMNSRRFMSGMGTSSPLRYQRRRLALSLPHPSLAALKSLGQT